MLNPKPGNKKSQEKKSQEKKSHHKKSHRKKSHHKKSHHKKSHHKKSHHKKSHCKKSKPKCIKIYNYPIPGPMGTQGPIGLTGPMGPIGLTGPMGTQGPIGLTGPMGTQGPIGLTGTQGPIGLTGTQGPIGLTGTQGPIGLTGIQGPIGLTGIQGLQGIPGGLISAADFYALMPGDNSATVAAGTAVSFPQDGPAYGTIVRNNDTQFILPDIGFYEINFQVSVTEAGQLVVVLDGTELLYTVVGRATGASQIVGLCLVKTTLINGILSINNPVGSASPLTITPLAGGTNSVSAHLVIKRVS
jgi:hypothetical protein